MSDLRRRLGVASVCVGLLSACTSVESGRGSLPTARPTRPVQVTNAEFPALRGSTGVDRSVSALATSGDAVVAVGVDHSGGVRRPLLLRSGDDGRTWQPGRVTGGDPPTAADDAFLVTARSGRFLAIGDGGDAAAAWTSDDGRLWRRRTLPASSLAGRAKLLALRPTARGYLLAGYLEPAGGRRVPAVWTSPDGVTWNQQAHGLRGAGNSSVEIDDVSVAPGGRTVVAVGVVDTGATAHAAMWRSADSGVSWQRVALDGAAATSKGRASLQGVVATSAGVTAVGAYNAPDRPYVGLVVTSTTGRSWRTRTVASGSRAQPQASLTQVVVDGSRLVAVGTQCSSACWPLVVSGGAGRALARRRLPQLQDLTVAGAVVTPRGTVLLGGGRTDRGATEVSLLRGGFTASFEQAAVRADRPPPDVAVSGVADDGRTEVAVGASGSAAVVWRRQVGAASFGRPFVLADDTTTSVTGVVHGPLGWLAWGSVGTDQPRAVVWSSRDGRQWRRAPGAPFGRPSAFGYSQVSAAVAFRGWTVVGDVSANGAPNESALVAGSRDGARWQWAPLRQFVAIPSRPPKRVYPLLGDEDGTRSMSAVTRCGSGLAAVGSASPARLASQHDPVAWVSRDGRRWDLQFLPSTARNDRDVTAAAVACRGRDAAIVGTEQVGTHDRLVAWGGDLATGGMTTATTPVASTGRGRVAIGGLVVTGSRFVVVGTAGGLGAARPFALVSDRGTDWRRVPLDDGRLSQPGDWRVTGVRATRQGVVAVAHRASTSGTTTFAFRIGV